MKKFINVSITPQESETLLAAQVVAESIWHRFFLVNNERLTLGMEVKPNYMDEPCVWWLIHPDGEYIRTGHERSLEAALQRMMEHTDAGVKRKQAERLRAEADRVENEAIALEAKGGAK